MLIGIAVLLCACTSWRCPQPRGSNPFLTVNHVSGGDSPVIYALEMYDDGLVRLDKVGFRSYCATVTSARVAEIQSLVDVDRLDAVEWSPEAGMDWEMAQVLAGDAEVRVVLEQIPEELEALFRALDLVFTDEFGSRYDMPLVDERANN